MNDINSTLAKLSRIPTQLDGQGIESSRLLADTWSIVGEDSRVNGCDSQARRDYMRTLDIIKAVSTKPATIGQAFACIAIVAHYGVSRRQAIQYWGMGKDNEAMDMLRKAAYEKGSAFGEYGHSTGHDVYEESDEYGDFRELSSVEVDRESHLSGQDDVRRYENKAAAIAKHGGRDYREMSYMSDWRKARYARLLAFIEACSDSDKLRRMQQRVWERYLASVKSCSASKEWFAQYLTKHEAREISSIITDKRAALRG